METVKTKLIHDRKSATPQYRGAMDGLVKIVRAEGFSGIYKCVLSLPPFPLRFRSTVLIRQLPMMCVFCACCRGVAATTLRQGPIAACFCPRLSLI